MYRIHRSLLAGILLLPLLFIPQESWQLGSGNFSCYETGDYSNAGPCPLFKDPLGTMSQPFVETFGDFTYVVFWGIIMGILWIRVQNTMMVGVVGVLLAAVFNFGFSHDTQVIGWGLLALAIGVALYQIISTKPHYPIN